jgi:hypothetical protein
VEGSCEFGIEPSGSIRCWETIEWPSSLVLSIIVAVITWQWPLYCSLFSGHCVAVGVCVTI